MVKASFLPGQSVLTWVSEEINRRVLWMRSGGPERVLYPDNGKELTCHQLTLTDATENASIAGWINVRPPSGAIASHICPKVLRC